MTSRLALIAENQAFAFVSGYGTICLGFREDLATVTFPILLLGEIALSSWIPVGHYQDPSNTGPPGPVFWREETSDC